MVLRDFPSSSRLEMKSTFHKKRNIPINNDHCCDTPLSAHMTRQEEGVSERESHTASWLEKQSQIPSHAIMKNLSSGRREVTVISGSPLMICSRMKRQRDEGRQRQRNRQGVVQTTQSSTQRGARQNKELPVQLLSGGGSVCT